MDLKPIIKPIDTKEYIKIDKDNYKIVDKIDDINLPAIKAEKTLLEAILLIPEEQRMKIITYSQPTAPGTFEEQVNARIDKINKDLTNCK